jgi:APA family basic amino acid/polyamine antiporter
MARDRLFPAAIRQIHGRFQTPANAIVAQSAWASVLLLVAYTWSAPRPVDASKFPSQSASGSMHELTIIETPQNPREAFDTLTDFVIFGGSIFYAMAVGAVFVLRRKMPDLPRPYRTWGYPVTPAIYLLAFGGAMASMLHDKWLQTAAGSLLIFAGVIAFYAMGGGRRAADSRLSISP